MDFWAQLEPTTQQALLTVVRAVGAFAVLMFLVSYVVLIERRVCAFIQDRVGPNRCGPLGLLQPAADAIKAFLKEDFTPAHVRRVLFTLAPALVMTPAVLNLAVIPFGSAPGTRAGSWVIADLNVGLVYVFGILSLSVYGIVLAGYASNSRYPLLGGLRSGAQLISYEVLMGLSVVPVFLWVGSLNLSEILAVQAGRAAWAPAWMPVPNWLVFQSPMTCLSFCLFLVAAFAETNRTPFDLPEAEQELAGGYNIEYSSMRFALFFMGEYAAMILASGLMTTLFFGGWTLPVWGLDRPAATVWGGLLHVGIFLGKVLALLLVFIWVRWMWPRFRYDQLMRLSWYNLIPLALVNILVTATWLWWRSL
ncbi:NADH-quinone oxidoreductase subunit NuoH [Limisphaera sp. 4302-co]|uniref:NADH-quinone oxidoreductase subunit NuoH n=1 Tax=Limisphaera sp. 4302-co TaxID=3400417 RepID=UPI003C2297F3